MFRMSYNHCKFLLAAVSVFSMSATVSAQQKTVAQQPASQRAVAREQPATVDESPDSGQGEATVERKKIRDHAIQGFVNIQPASGVFMVAPYDKNDPQKACGYNADGESEAVCTGATSWHLDILGGFGVRPGLELALMYRQGLEKPAIGRPQQRMFGGGIKVYNPKDGLFKIGLGLVLLFDFSERAGQSANDMVIHFPIQAQFDIVRWFGVYAQTSANISFASEFRFDVNFGIGVQARFP